MPDVAFSLPIRPLSLTALAGLWSLSCSAQRHGSGLRGLTASLNTVDSAMVATPLAGASGNEVATSDFYLGGGSSMINIPAGTTKLYLKVAAASQDTTITGNDYSCTVFIN